MSLSWSRQKEKQRAKKAAGDFHPSYLLTSFCSIYLVVRLQLKLYCLRTPRSNSVLDCNCCFGKKRYRKLFLLLEKGLRSTGEKQRKWVKNKTPGLHREA